MHELLRYLEDQQPRINAYLDAETDKLDELVKPVVRHVLRAGGKRLRPLLTLMTARGLGYVGDDIYLRACSLEFLHSATLLHDDILDAATLRRGFPAAHLVFGHTLTILAGDALLALGNMLMAQTGDPRLNMCISEAIMRTALGEIAEITRTRDASLRIDEYLDIITGKTAYLIQAACACGALLAKAEERYERAAAQFGLNLGVAFQLVDDALDYASTTEKTGKPVGADLREGKLTLPLLYYLQTAQASERDALIEKIKTGDMSDEDVREYVRRVQVAGGDRKARELAGEYLDKAAAGLALFPDSPEKPLLGQMIQYVHLREK
jgi:octaprenyl-diphosphate synthase